MDDETREQYWELNAKILGIRDVVARLLAYRISESGDPDGLLSHFSDSTQDHLISAQKGKEPNAEVIKLQEQIQAQVDWIVAAARTMAEDEEE